MTPQEPADVKLHSFSWLCKILTISNDNFLPCDENFFTWLQNIQFKFMLLSEQYTLINKLRYKMTDACVSE